MSVFAEYQPMPVMQQASVPDDIIIRKVRLRDVPHLAYILQERSGGDYVHCLDCFRREVGRIDLPHRLLLVAEYRSRIIGYGRVVFFESAAEPLAKSAPRGWYLGGLLVASDMRRRGVALRLTHERLAWVAQQSTEAYYISNVHNRISIGLHRKFGFEEVTREFIFPGMEFTGGTGALFRAELGAEIGKP